VQGRPGVLILEDVHWIDTASEEVLAALAEAMGESSLLLVLVYRPEYTYAWTDTASHTQITLTRLSRASSAAMVRAMLAKPYATRVRLERLTPAQSQAMVQDLVGTTVLPREFEQFITTKGDGNPLFVEELTRALVESGALVREPAGYRLRAAPTALNIPATVQGVLLARIDRLPVDLKTVLQAASVMGRVFSYPILAQVVAPVIDLDQVLLQLEELEFLYSLSPTPQGELSFKHVLTQEAVYQTLLRPHREEYHARIAQAIETLSAARLEEVCEVLAHHYVRSGLSYKAVEYLTLANQKAAKVNAITEAKQYFETAMALLDTLPDTEGYQRRRLELLVSQLVPMLLLMKIQEYYDLLLSYEAMAAGLGNTGLLGALYGRTGFCEWWLGRLEQAITTLTKAVALCEAAGNAEDAAQAYVILQWSYVFTGDYDQVLALKERAIQALEQHMNVRYYVWSHAAVSWALTGLGRWEEAVALGRRALHIGETYTDGSLISFAAWSLSFACTSQGDLAQACTYGELAVQQAPTPGDKAWAEAFLAWAWCRVGEVSRSVEVQARSVATQRGVGFVWGAHLSALWLGEAYWLAGAYDSARQTLEALLTPAEQHGMRLILASAHRHLGEVALTTNPTQREAPLAAPHFERSMAILQQIGAENELALAYAGYGRLHQQQGDLAQARAYLTRALAIFERLGTLREPDRIRQLLALQEGMC